MIFKSKTVLAAVFVLLVFFAVGCAKTAGANGQADEKPATAGDVASGQSEQKSDEQADLEQKYLKSDQGQGGVTVEALWVTPEYLAAAVLDDPNLKKQAEKNLVFEIFLTTHGGDLLKEFDVLSNVELLVDGRSVKPSEWKLNQADPHHPAGTVVFPKVLDNEPVLGENTKELKLVVKNLRDVPERVLIWRIP